VPVCILSSTSEFRQYTRNVLEPAIPDAKEIDLYLDRADSFSRNLVDYKLAVIEVDGATLQDAMNIFSRINSQGTTISDDWKVNALSFSENFNFSTEVDNVIERLKPYNFESLSRDTIFRCYQSAFDDKLYIDTDIESLARHPDFQPVVKKMSEAIIRAVDFLFNNLNVIDNRLLPYTSQLVFLSVFFMKEPYPSNAQIYDLVKWFWITTYSNYFTANSLSGQRKAFIHFIDYIGGWTDTPLYDETPYKHMKTQPWPKKLSLSSARATALVLFQLQCIRRMFSSLPYNRNLVIKKIFKMVDTKPENMAVTFGDSVTKEHLPYCVPVTHNVFPDDIDKELSFRASAIKTEERLFVESLGLEYE